MDKLAVLRQYFGFPAFRAGQQTLIDAVLSGRDALGVMPTGGGKSLCYELPAPLAFLPVSLYNGQRGRCSRAEQWAFCLFYPAHLALLAAVTNLLL